MRFFVSCLLLFILYSLFFVFASPTRAQSLSLSISPPILEVMIKPGKSITQVYKITNLADSAILTPKLASFGAQGVKIDPNFVQDAWIEIINKDIHFNQPFLLKGGETRQIILQVHPSAGIKEADYYRTLLFTTSPTVEGDTTQTLAQSTIGSILLVTISETGFVQKRASLTKFQTPLLLDSFGPLESTVEVQNVGETYFRPIGQFTLTGPIGKAEYKIDPHVLFPGETKKLTVETQPENVHSSLLLPGFYIGKYQLTISFSLDAGNIMLEDKRTIYAVPWKAAIIVIIGCIVILFVQRTGIRKTKSK